MAEIQSIEAADFTKIGDPDSNIGAIKTYGGSITPCLRTPEYDAYLCCGDAPPGAHQERLLERRRRHEATLERIANQDLSLQSIIPRHVLEKTYGIGESGARLYTQMRALTFLARLVRGGVELHVATPDADDRLLLNAGGGFSLIGYTDGRPRELSIVSPITELIIAREDDPEFKATDEGFDRVWDDPSTIKPPEVINYLYDIASSLENRL